LFVVAHKPLACLDCTKEIAKGEVCIASEQPFRGIKQYQHKRCYFRLD
jgi:hypothetical protein